LRDARTGYDHLAGRVGVELMSRLMQQGHLIGGDGTYDPSRAEYDHRTGYGHDVDYTLSERGAEFVAEFGLRVAPQRRLVRYCVDWSEQRHHLAGALGRGLLDRFSELKWIHRSTATRAVQISDTGRAGLNDTFGVCLR
jgi:hypothetical protein